MEELAQEVKWGEWGILQATDLFTEHVQPQLEKLIMLQELIDSSTIMSVGWNEEYGRLISGGIYELLREATESIREFREMIRELVENERPAREAYKKKEDARRDKKLMYPENLEKSAEHLLKEAEKIRVEAAEIREAGSKVELHARLKILQDGIDEILQEEKEEAAEEGVSADE